ncbi:alpha/beta hydrolase [Clostridium sp. C8-1-8]|uniref:alpha/beta fold hydrolase n=1 Tax=Clostridium sp. C8-1-8 TaxID=2698831 RepID=UPI00137003E5|nr:alpha/beta hydrolase [Clostridium sp. C8-1-8]
MKFYEFGDKNNPSLFLIHGTASHWQLSFGQAIEGLIDQYYVVCVAITGYDDNDSTELISISEEVDKLEAYIKTNYDNKIFAIYGSSLGGSIVAKLLERGNVLMDHAITGSTDFDYMSGVKAIICSIILARVFYKYARDGEIKGILKLFVRSEESKKYLEDLHKVIYKNTTYETLYKEYYTDLIMTIDDNIRIKKTKVHCIFGMKEDVDKLVGRYKKHFPEAEIIGLVGLNHEELLFKEPKEWVNMIKTLLKQGEYRYHRGTQKFS